MHITITSKNKNFDKVLLKNKESNLGLFMQPHKNGHFVGNFVNDYVYEIIFQDTKYSYSNQDMSNMLDINSFVNPKIFLDIGKFFFKHLIDNKIYNKNVTFLGGSIKDFDTHSCEMVYNVEINSNWAKDNKFILSKIF